MEASFFLKFVKPVLNLLGFAKSKSEKKYLGYKFYKSLGIEVKKEDFETLYNGTLYELESKTVKHPLLIDLFKLNTAREAFKKEFFSGVENVFFDDLDVNISVDERFKELKDASINLRKEVEEFAIVFSEKVNQSKSPKELEDSKGLKELNQKVESLILQSKNTYLPEQLKEISNLREKNKHYAAIELLDKYRETKWHELTPELKYSVILNLAVTYFDIGEKKKAAYYFIKLVDIDYKKEDALGYASLGYALLENVEKSIEYANKALECNEENITAYLGLLFSKEDTLELEELDTLIPKHIQDKPEIAINIGAFFERKKEFDKAYNIFEKLDREHLEMDAFKSDILVQLANNRISSIEQRGDYYLNQLDEDSLSKIEFASKKLEEAWSLVKDTDLRKVKWYILTNRGVSYKLLGKIEKAEEDFKASLELNKNFLTYRHLLLLKWESNQDYSSILNEIEKLPLEEDEKTQLIIFNADKLFSDRKYDEVLNLLLPQSSIITNEELNKQVLSIIIEVYSKQKNFDKAEEFTRSYIERFSTDPIGFYNLSKIAYSKADKERAGEYMQTAKKLLDSKTPHQIIDLIADRFIEMEDFRSSAEILELATDKNILSKLSKKLIWSYYRDGNYKSAIAVSQPLFRKYKSEPFLADLISTIYEINQDLDKTIDSLKSYLELVPNDNFLLVKFSILYCKKEDYKSGVEILDRISDFASMPVHVQFQIAYAYIMNKNFDKGLHIAYKLRAENYLDPTAHTNYMQCITTMNNQPKDVYFPNVVNQDCYVALNDRSGKRYEFVIVEHAKFTNEISIDDPLSKILIDKAIGAEVTLNNEVLMIQLILWKYTYALHDSMDQLYVRFGNEQPVKVLKIKEGDNPIEKFEDLFSRIDSSHDFDKQVEDLYLQGKSTIGTNSSISGVSPIKYWGKLINSWNAGITSIGSILEFRLGVEFLEKDRPLILDITAILTLYHLDAFVLLENLKCTKYVTKSTVDIIENEIVQIQSNIEGETLVVDKIGSQYVRHIITVEEKQKNVESLQYLLDKVNTHCEVVSPELSENYRDKTEKDRLFGISFNESMLISREKSCLLYSDDLYFRLLCFNEYGLNGISTFILLRHQNKTQYISQSQYDDLIEKLIKLNYRSIPVSPILLFKIFSFSQYTIRQPFINACDFIDPKFLNDIEASKFVVNFLYEVYTSTFEIHNKAFVTQFILSKLYENRNVFQVKKYMFALLDSKFFLLPLQKDEVMMALRAI